MDYEQFKTYVKKGMEAVTGEPVEIFPVVKNNSVVCDGLSVRPKGECVAVPTIYLGKYYESYKNGTPAPELVRDMMTLYETKKRKIGIHPSKFRDFSWMKDNVGFKLINRVRNKELLKKIPHCSFLDLEIVYYVAFLDTAEGYATMLIENEHLNIWGISKEDVHRAALFNMPRLFPAAFQPMDLVMEQLYQKQVEVEIARYTESCDGEWETEDLERMASELIRNIQESQKVFPMYVLSNSKGLFGAGAVLYCDMLKNWAEEAECDLFLIPSSIHEMLVMPSVGFYSAPEISEMVKEINASHVAAEEILSDHVYIYHRNEGKITI